MELEIYSAFVRAGIAAEDAKAAVDSISKEIDKRYSLHAQQLATRGDLEQMKSELTKQMMQMQSDLTKWIVASMFAGIGAVAALVKILH